MKRDSATSKTAVSPMLALCLAAIVVGGCSVKQGAYESQGDPLEGYNRGVFAVNETLDGALIKPVAKGYGLLPAFVRDRVTNFFGNLADVPNAINNLLQGKPRRALSDTLRVVLNTTFGLVGFFDVAAFADLEKSDEDFGQTLAVWGVGSGPYFMLPLLGPSTLRDFPAAIVDFLLSPLSYLDLGASRVALTAAESVDTRQRFLAKEAVVREVSPDFYSAVRSFYLENRRQSIEDGKGGPDEDGSLYEDL